MVDPKNIIKNKFRNKLYGMDIVDELSEMKLQDLEPLPWQNYFSHETIVHTGRGKFHAFTAGKGGPLCVLIHGAGMSAASWCLFTKELLKHAQLRVIAPDLRGHGLTFTSEDNLLSKDVLVDDLINIIEKTIIESNITEDVILIGHSLGGALATWIAARSLSFHIVCLIVIDIDESSALDHASMLLSLDSRPEYFTSLPLAIKYSHTHRKIKNLEADRACFPSELREVNSDDSTFPAGSYTWRIDLYSTEPFWDDWFKGVSQQFFNLKVPRILVLSDIERIDKNLMIGQMQGLFKVQPIQKCGHTIHEDDPIEISLHVINYLKQQRII